MLLLTANESKHLGVGMALDKKPAGPRNSFIIRPTRPFFSLFPFRLPLWQRPCRHYRKFPFRWCHLSITASCCPFVVRSRRLSLTDSLWDLSRMRIPPSGHLSNYTDLWPLSATVIPVMSRISDALNGWARRASFKTHFRAFRAEQQKIKQQR